MRRFCSKPSLGFACFALVALASGAARADEPFAQFVFFGSAAYSSLSDMRVDVAALATEPDVLKGKGIRVSGDGAMSGGGFKLVVGSDIRGGLGMNIFGAQGYGLHYAPLAPGIRVTNSSFWGETIDLFLGKQWALWGMRPYLDLRMAFTIFQANVKLQTDSYGVLGSTPYDGFSFGIGPRAGVIIPLGQTFFVDWTAYGSPIGAEKFASTLGIGISMGGETEYRPPKRRLRVPATW